MSRAFDTDDRQRSSPESDFDSNAKSCARSAGEPGGRQRGRLEDQVGDDCGAVARVKAFHPDRACDCERLGLDENAECVHDDPCWTSEAAYRRSPEYVCDLERRLRAACEPCAECGHIDWRELDDVLEADGV